MKSRKTRALFAVLCGAWSALHAGGTLVTSSDGSTVYDTSSNISWLSDANLAASNTFGLPYCTTHGAQDICVNPGGAMNYNSAVAWVQAMNAANYLGHRDWQLPTTPAVDKNCGKTGPNGQSFGFGCTAGALDTMYNSLGLTSPNTAVSIPPNTIGAFTNIQPYLYWSQSVAPSGATAGNATFSFATGWQGANTLPNFLYIWPMIPGKIAGTPSASGMGLQVNPGGATVYDPITNITWIADANLAATNAFALPQCTSPTNPAMCVAQDGAMTMASATQYIANMNRAAYLGQTNWQLPTIDPSCPGYNCSGTLNPMGNLYYSQLGFSAGMSTTPVSGSAAGAFHNLQPYLYWTCVGNTIQAACQTAGPAANFEQSYSFGSGFQGTDVLSNSLYVTAYFVGAPASITPPVTTTTVLPHIADGNKFDTVVLLINTGGTDANYALQFFDQTGAPVTYPLDSAQAGMSGVIRAGSQAMVRTAGSGTTTHLGWGKLVASPAVKGMLIYQQQTSATSLQEGSAPFTAPSQHFFFPFDNTGNSTTSIGFVNPNPNQTAIVNFTVRYETGGADSVPSFNMSPSQQVAQTLAGIWSKSSGQRGMVEINSSTPIGMVAFRFQGATFTLFDIIPDTEGGTFAATSTIAHTADGDNFKSTFILTNSGTVASPYTLTILSASGETQTFPFDVARPLSGTIAAGSTLTIDTTGLGTVTNFGWAQLAAAPAVGGIEVFRQTDPGQSEQQATIPISSTSQPHFFLPYDNAANVTSIALSNPDPAITAVINVTFRNTDGSLNSGQLILSPRNYMANQLANLFPVTAAKTGVAEFISNVPVAIVEVRFNPTQAFTSLRAVSP